MAQEYRTTEEMRSRITPSSPLAVGVRDDGCVFVLMLRADAHHAPHVLPPYPYKLILLDDTKLSDATFIDQSKSNPETKETQRTAFDPNAVRRALEGCLAADGKIVLTSQMKVR